MKKKELNFLTFKIILISTFLVFLDQFSKYFFMNKYYFENFFIHIFYSQNTGSAFSIFSNINFYNNFISIISIIVLIILIFKFKFFLENKYYFYSFIFLISGILGNLIDRILFGYVRDFIVLKYFFIFNFADTYLSLALIYFFLYEIEQHGIIKENKK